MLPALPECYVRSWEKKGWIDTGSIIRVGLAFGGLEEITPLGLLFPPLSGHCSYLDLRPFQPCDLNLQRQATWR